MLRQDYCLAEFIAKKLIYVYAYDEYLDSDDVNESADHVDEDGYEVLFHPMKNHAHVDDVHHGCENAHEIMLHAYEHDHDAL